MNKSIIKKIEEQGIVVDAVLEAMSNEVNKKIIENNPDEKATAITILFNRLEVSLSAFLTRNANTFTNSAFSQKVLSPYAMAVRESYMKFEVDFIKKMNPSITTKDDYKRFYKSYVSKINRVEKSIVEALSKKEKPNKAYVDFIKNNKGRQRRKYTINIYDELQKVREFDMDLVSSIYIKQILPLIKKLEEFGVDLSEMHKLIKEIYNNGFLSTDEINTDATLTVSWGPNMPVLLDPNKYGYRGRKGVSFIEEFTLNKKKISTICPSAEDYKKQFSDGVSYFTGGKRQPTKLLFFPYFKHAVMESNRSLFALISEIKQKEVLKMKAQNIKDDVIDQLQPIKIGNITAIIKGSGSKLILQKYLKKEI